tara:strand:+ start:7963 stop:8298 length:336 start_codon:yes stop_codon:yes gene_type:complete
MEITRDNYTEARKLTETYVREHLTRFLLDKFDPINLSEENFEHVIDTGVSILETKYPEIGIYLGGDFVKAFVNNDLMSAIGRADQLNERLLGFYAVLLYNFTPNNLKYPKL